MATETTSFLLPASIRAKAFIGVREWAEIRGVRVQSIHKARMLGLDAPHVKVGRRILYPTAQLEKFLTARFKK
jgi:hypothetical protein